MIKYIALLLCIVFVSAIRLGTDMDQFGAHSVMEWLRVDVCASHYKFMTLSRNSIDFKQNSCMAELVTTAMSMDNKHFIMYLDSDCPLDNKEMVIKEKLGNRAAKIVKMKYEPDYILWRIIIETDILMHQCTSNSNQVTHFSLEYGADTTDFSITVKCAYRKFLMRDMPIHKAHSSKVNRIDKSYSTALYMSLLNNKDNSTKQEDIVDKYFRDGDRTGHSIDQNHSSWITDEQWKSLQNRVGLSDMIGPEKYTRSNNMLSMVTLMGFDKIFNAQQGSTLMSVLYGCDVDATGDHCANSTSPNITDSILSDDAQKMTLFIYLSLGGYTLIMLYVIYWTVNYCRKSRSRITRSRNKRNQQ